jgi:hypothetical protein
MRELLLLLIAGTGVEAADISGKWSFEGDVAGNPVKLECEMKQEGMKLSGTCKTQGADVQVAGEVNDPKVRFSYSVDHEGTTYTLYYSGTLDSADSMAGEIGVAGVSGTFSAKRKRDQAR